MCRARFTIFLFLSILPFLAVAQEHKVALSNPLNMKTSGVYKVLLMDNGNTFLFHFDIGKPLTIKMFDSTRKLRYTRQYLGNYLDVAMMRTTLFKGLFEVNGEAVLFLEQTHSGRNNLLRFRFNGASGNLVEEEMMGESKSMAKQTHFQVMYNKEQQRYAILYSTDVRQFKTCDMQVLYYDEHHRVDKEVPLKIDRKKYDQVDITGAEWNKDGVAITASLLTLEVNGTTSDIGNDPVMDIYKHDLTTFYIPEGSDRAGMFTTTLGTDIYPYYTNVTYNPFAESINVHVLSYIEKMCRFGIDIQPMAQVANLFLRVSANMDTAMGKWVENKMAAARLKRKSDSVAFKGLPISLYTNDRGVSTLISTSLTKYRTVGSHIRSDAYANYFGAPTAALYNNTNPIVSQAMYNHRIAELNAKSDINESYLGNIAVTQLDDNGVELGGVLLPRRQYMQSYQRYYSVKDLSKNRQEHCLFNDVPPQVWHRQFTGQNVYLKGDDVFVVFNDLNSNFRNSVEKPGDTVFYFGHTNPVYYKVNRKREVEKKYLFGETSLHEFKPAFVEGACYNERRGVYATVVQYTRGEYTSLKLAWATLD